MGKKNNVPLIEALTEDKKQNLCQRLNRAAILVEKGIQDGRRRWKKEYPREFGESWEKKIRRMNDLPNPHSTHTHGLQVS